MPGSFQLTGVADADKDARVAEWQAIGATVDPVVQQPDTTWTLTITMPTTGPFAVAAATHASAAAAHASAATAHASAASAHASAAAAMERAAAG